MQEIILPESSQAAGKRIVELPIPPNVNILAIKRSGVFIAPNGSTKLMPGDKLNVLAEDKDALDELKTSLGMETTE